MKKAVVETQTTLLFQMSPIGAEPRDTLSKILACPVEGATKFLPHQCQRRLGAGPP
jgi:hypothetical protein